MTKILCDEVMTKNVIACSPDDTVVTVAQLMLQNHVGSIPVLNDPETRELAGVVTDRDIVIRVVAAGENAAEKCASDIMTSEMVTCRPADDLEQAVSLMMEHQIRRLFVVEHGRLLGVIAQADIASRGGVRNATAQLVERVSQPGVPEPTHLS